MQQTLIAQALQQLGAQLIALSELLTSEPQPAQDQPAATEPAAPKPAARKRAKKEPSVSQAAQEAATMADAEPPAPVRPVLVEPVLEPVTDPGLAWGVAMGAPGIPVPAELHNPLRPWALPLMPATTEAVREELKPLITATVGLHPAEGREAVVSALLVGGARKLSDVPDWALPGVRQALVRANIDLRLQIARGELD